MKKTLLALLAIASPAIAQDTAKDAVNPDALKVYGAFYPIILMETTTTKDFNAQGASIPAVKKDTASMSAGTSRLGFRGKTVINQDIKGIYQLEYAVNFDHPFTKETQKDSLGADITREVVKKIDARDSFVGIESLRHGTLKAGRLLAINDYVLNLPDALPSAYYTGRFSNAISYKTPEFKDGKLKNLTAYAMVVLNEGKDANEFGSHLAFVGGEYKLGKNTLAGSYNHFNAKKGSVMIKDSTRLHYTSELDDKNTVYGTLTLSNFNDKGANKTEQGFAGAYNHKFNDKWEAYAQVNHVAHYGGKSATQNGLYGGVTYTQKANMQLDSFVWATKLREPSAFVGKQKTEQATGLALRAQYRF